MAETKTTAPVFMDRMYQFQGGGFLMSENKTTEQRAAEAILAGFRGQGFYGPDPLKDMAEHAARILASRGLLAEHDADEGTRMRYPPIGGPSHGGTRG